MSRFLTILRRLSGGGLVGLALTLLGTSYSYIDLINIALLMSSVISYYCLFVVLSPLLYLLFLFICTAYVRKNGLNAANFKREFYIFTLFKMIGSDIISPFKCLWRFISGTILGRYAGYDFKTRNMKSVGQMRVKFAIRFIWMCAVLLFILYGIGSLA